jgi:DNA modification methylase
MINRFSIAPQYTPDARTVVFEGDCRKMLRDIPAGAVQLVVTSPPYNLGKEYEDRLHLDDYLAEQREVNLLTAPWLAEKTPDDQMAFLEKPTRYRVRK